MKKNIDLLNGNILLTISKISIPIMLTSLINMAYNLTDMFWIGKLGSDSVASVGISATYLLFAQALSMLARAGGQFKVGHSLGASKPKEAVRYAQTALQMGVIIGFCFSSFILIFGKDLLNFYNLSANVEADGLKYLRITAGLSVFNIQSLIYSGLINATGNSRTPFYIQTIGLIANMILDPLLIFGVGFIPELGIMGAAIATVFSQFVVVLLFYIYSRRDTKLLYETKYISKINLNYVKQISSIGIFVVIQRCTFAIINIVMSKIIATWGDAAMAVLQVGIQVESISWMAAEGFSSAVNAFMAQNYGANNLSRTKEGFYKTIAIVTIWGLATASILIFLPKEIFSLFIDEQSTLALGIDYLIILGYSQLFMCIEITSAGGFNGLGNTKPPSIVSTIFTTMRIPLALILSSTTLGLNGVWWSISLSSMIKGTMLLTWIILFMKKLSVHSK